MKFMPRISKKKSGQVTVKDGQWKMEVKERFRLLGIFTAVFVLGIAFLFFVLPLLFSLMIGLLALLYMTSSLVIMKIHNFIRWTGSKIINTAKWTGKWCFWQPVEDFRFGRRKRKEFERSRVYGE